MDEIPEDVTRAATEIWLAQGDWTGVELLERAILAERERCAKVAESYEREAGPLMRGLADAIRTPAK